MTVTDTTKGANMTTQERWPVGIDFTGPTPRFIVAPRDSDPRCVECGDTRDDQFELCAPCRRDFSIIEGEES